jgi:vacuolar-type H+-ATPase subunit C/Vma6
MTAKTIIISTIASSVLVTAYYMYNKYRNVKLVVQAIKDDEQLLDTEFDDAVEHNLEAEELPVEMGKDAKVRKNRRFVRRCAGMLAQEVRLRFGCVVRNEINEACVRNYTRGIMNRRNIRITHQAAMVDKIVNMVFNYTPRDAYNDRYKEAQASLKWWRGLFGGHNPTQA